MEHWIDIIGFENYYAISNLGRIKRKPRYRNFNGGNKKLMPELILTCNTKVGYPSIVLFNGSKKITKAMHILMAQHFIPNPLKKPEVNHKDKNIFNYSLDNLEWHTRSENMLHAKSKQ